ncbi:MULTISPECIES: Bax inhibitor-1/YccA family protein [unclassified Breznakia]|uniref:Bax inhibitor-1/YccA family protein n=1 Tax=unclassified Breznakia TaxID=2623764 RepID=UPI0024749FA6|nr:MULTISPECIES: Bax inhibitor-1/YccA family protein [unclassified Breznakia]MDH6366270.1 FtsH-binding integral membrane protein [Breznakia sp. PH1-1]MDH6403363.1 FtsH-binding integral membrane protein [Breznakia sp. PF1-11]MDH6411072.1 FtsH-binding integral membrane protein [Breznakia sp. PFB1-11]MDH6413436.1 FtsH-binding integral membrane protein [Breznakia sp. PFB1-14]MDH6416775.1 FtsH-binding integral membrane protein [Breznakia sp. PFB1-4]
METYEGKNGPELSINNENSLRKQLTKTFGWMFLGLAVTFGVAFYLYNTPEMMYSIFSSRFGVIAIVIAQFAIVIAFSSLVFKVRPAVALALFMGYAAITGVTFSVLPIIYNVATIAQAFAMAAVYFACLMVIGLTTKKDLTKIGSIAMAGLFAMIIYSFISMLFGWSRDSFVYSFIGLIVFAGLTAWDAQKMKTIYARYQNDSEMVNRASIYMALELYLDFINIFLFILRILGGSKND